MLLLPALNDDVILLVLVEETAKTLISKQKTRLARMFNLVVFRIIKQVYVVFRRQVQDEIVIRRNTNIFLLNGS